MATTIIETNETTNTSPTTTETEQNGENSNASGWQYQVDGLLNQYRTNKDSADSAVLTSGGQPIGLVVPFAMFYQWNQFQEEISKAVSSALHTTESSTTEVPASEN